MSASTLLTYAKGLEAIGGLVTTILRLGNTAESQQKLLELNSVILAAHESAFRAQAHESALLEENGTLKEELRSLSKWEEEKQRYQLHSFESGGFAYALKGSAKGDDPPHWICATCYQEGRKTILQKGTHGQMEANHVCAFKHPPLIINWRIKPEYA